MNIFKYINKIMLKLKRETKFELFLFIIFLTFLIITRSSYHLLFHTSAEFYVCIVSFGLFFITLYSSGINANYFIVFLGIGYFFTSIIDMFHIFTYTGVSIIFDKGNQSIVVQFWISARYLTAITLLISTLLLLGKIKNIKVNFVFFSYFVICIVILSSILYFKIFPACYIIGHGLTVFKICSEYIISIVLIFVAIVYYKLRHSMDKKLFIFMECHLISMAISEILFTSFFTPFDWTNIWSHIVRVISYFFLYKAIIESGLKRPYAVLYHKIDKIGNELHIASNKLIQEQRQRSLIEEILIKNEKCYELIINNSSDAIFVINENVVICANLKAAKIFGIDDPNNLVGLNWLDFIQKDEREKIDRYYQMLKTNNYNPSPYETKIISLNRYETNVEILSYSLIYQNKLSYMNILKDISPNMKIRELKNEILNNEIELNQTKEFNKLQTEFFSNISHEFKTPLNVILAAIQILYISESNLEKYLKIMKQNCYRLLRLVNNLIDLTKFDIGYSNLDLRNQNIVTLVKNIVFSVEDYICNRGLEITFSTNVEEKTLAIDSDKIERIILNLLSNSIKFTDKGGKIYINLKDTNDLITISIRDTGIGIPEDRLSSILDRFSQINKTLSRNQEGSGLGLSIVKKLVEMHDGRIEVKSILGEGSEFIIKLPFKTIKEERIIEYVCSGESRIQRIDVEFSDIYPD